MVDEILRPNSDIYTTGWNKTEADYHSCVDEVTKDDDTTYVTAPTTAVILRLGLPNPGLSGTITKVTIYNWVRSTNASYEGAAKTLIRTGGNIFYGTLGTPGTSYVEYKTEYANNPNTSNAWTWDEIDALECGVYAYAGQSGEFPNITYYPLRCTQVYIEIEYTPAVNSKKASFFMMLD